MEKLYSNNRLFKDNNIINNNKDNNNNSDNILVRVISRNLAISLVVSDEIFLFCAGRRPALGRSHIERRVLPNIERTQIQESNQTA
jgi:hypothetical protein